MNEEKIVVIIDKDGNIKAEVKGILGNSCEKEVMKLLQDLAEIENINKTDEYFMETEVRQNIIPILKQNCTY